MQRYLVGGAVRDQLLGRPLHDRDWVVVGQTPAAMLAAGYQPVGKDFPVFLDPESKEEVALARTERKVGQGYTGFACVADPSVTLVEDLLRRDLTINAMAQASDGTLIDPYNGQADLQARWLRHVSEAFVEDPLRVLRLARFAARLPTFSVHPETMALLQKMVIAGELQHLVAERVWQETERALQAEVPTRFFDVLAACGARAQLWPEIKSWSLPLAALRCASLQQASWPVCWAVLCARLPLADVKALGQRLRVPKQGQQLAELLASLWPCYRATPQPSAAQQVAFLEQTDAYRRPERLRPLLTACVILNASQAGQPPVDAIEQTVWWRAFQQTQGLRFADLAAPGLTGDAIGTALHQQRIALLDKFE